MKTNHLDLCFTVWLGSNTKSTLQYMVSYLKNISIYEACLRSVKK